MQLTDEQLKVAHSAHDLTKVVAYAGTGKTTTLRGFAEHNVTRTLYLAFNKSTAESAKRVFPRHVRSSTIHGLAWQQFGRERNLQSIPAWKLAKLWQCKFSAAAATIDTLNTWMNSAAESCSEAHVSERIGNVKIDQEMAKQIAAAARQLWQRMLDKSQDDDYPLGHSGYLKLFQLSRPSLDFDIILLDESQDTNPVTLDIVMRQKDRSRIVMVGDPLQQIYSWRGAVDAMDHVECPTYNLTESWRFGPEIAESINHLLGFHFPEIPPLIGSGQPGSLSATVPTATRYTHIARTNVGLFNYAIGTVPKKVYIMGGAGEACTFIEDLYTLWKGVDVWRIRNANIRAMGSYSAVEQMVETGFADADLVLGHRLISKYGDRLPAQINLIKNCTVADPNKAQVILSTTHKAKGAEWDSVSVGDDFCSLMDDTGSPSDIVTKPDGITYELTQEEFNLIYVAITRARQVLRPSTDITHFFNYVKWSKNLDKVDA